MSCLKIYDFIGGNDMKLAAPHCRILASENDHIPATKLLHPDEAAVDLMRRHLQTLNALAAAH